MAITVDYTNLSTQLLNRNPRHRLGATFDAKELKAHPFFNDIDWDALVKKNVIPPFKPKLSSETDTSNFDPEFTNVPMTGSLQARAIGGNLTASTPLSPTLQANFRGFTFVDESTMEENFGSNNRHSTLDIMDEDHEGEWDDHNSGMGSLNQDGRSFGDRGNRMSGVIRTGEGEEGVFNGGFDM